MNNVNNIELIKIYFSNWYLTASVNIILFVLIVLSPVIIKVGQFFVNFLGKKVAPNDFQIDQVALGVGKSGVVIKPNYQDRQIAYKLWVEVSTRKIGIPLDWDNDVIVEVYNSWYDFFKITRELIKDVPIEKIRKHESTKIIIDVAIKILNNQLRPHLTKWQAKFRKWYNTELNKTISIKLTPQQIQQKYIYYKELKRDLNLVSEKIIAYRDVLEELIK